MSLIDSPDLEDFEDGLPPEEKPSLIRLNWMRILIVTLGIIVAGVGLVSVLINADFLGGHGGIQGQVIDRHGNPVSGAEIHVSEFDGWGESDAQGFFLVKEIPAGDQIVVVVVTPMPDTAPEVVDVEILRGETIDLGVITYQAMQ